MIVQTGPLREAALDAANANGGVSVARILSGLDDLLADPQIAGDPTRARAIAAARKSVEDLGAGGNVDARTLYAARKSLNAVVAKAADESGGTSAAQGSRAARRAQEKQQSWLSHQIQLVYDDAIKTAAGKEGGKWSQYLTAQRVLRGKIDAHRDRAREAERIAKGVKPLSSQIVPGEIPKPPTLLNRKMMFANWFLSKLGADANDPVVKELARALQDPAEFAKLLQRPTQDPLRMRAVEAMKRGEQMAAEAFILNQQGGE